MPPDARWMTPGGVLSFSGHITIPKEGFRQLSAAESVQREVVRFHGKFVQHSERETDTYQRAMELRQQTVIKTASPSHSGNLPVVQPRKCRPRYQRQFNALRRHFGCRPVRLQYPLVTGAQPVRVKLPQLEQISLHHRQHETLPPVPAHQKIQCRHLAGDIHI